MRVLLLHGWGGSDFPHWQSWLAGELAKEYGCVDFVRLPSFDAPKRDEWIDVASLHIEQTRPDVVVCHSLGNTLWFHMCNEKSISHRVKALYLVAPPSLQCDILELQSFFPVELPHDIHADETELIVSDNDPYLSVDEAHSIQSKLGVRMHLLKDAGHINTQSGYGEWPWILQQIQERQQS